MKGGEDVLRQLSPMESLSYYYFIKYPPRRDVDISTRSGIKLSTLVTARKKLTSKGLLKYSVFPFNFSEPRPYLFLLTVESERTGDESKCEDVKVVQEGSVSLILSMSDGRSTASFVYAARYTDFFRFKHQLLREIYPRGGAAEVKEHCLLREGLVALNLFDHSRRVARELLSEISPARLRERLREEEAALGDNELIILPDVTGAHLRKEEMAILNALFRDPTMNYVKLSWATGINRQRAARIKKRLDEEVYYRPYVDPFSTLRESELVVIHAMEHSGEVDGGAVASLYKESRDEFREYNVLFLHSRDTSVMIEIYPTYREFRKRSSDLEELMGDKPFHLTSHHTLVMTPGESFEARVPSSFPSRERSSEAPHSRR